MKQLVVLVIGLLLALPLVHALAVGISPSKFIIESGLKGTEYERSLRFSTTADEDIVVKLGLDRESENFTEWVTFYDKEGEEEISTLDIPAKGQAFSRVVFSVPEDAANGDYIIKMTAQRTSKNATGETAAAVSLITSSVVRITVTGDQLLEGTVRSVTTKDTETGQPLRIKVDFENTGNVRATPDVTVTILDEDGEEVDSTSSSNTEVTVNTAEIVEVEWDTAGRGVGDFSANVVTELDGTEISQETVEFSILERGSLLAEGGLGEVSDPTNMKPGRVVKLEAEFYNRGELDVTAKLKGEVYHEGDLIDQFDGDEVLVKVSDRGMLTAYFTPEETGEYTVTREVTFEGKTLEIDDLTFELDKEGTKAEFTASTGSSSATTIAFIVGGLIVLVVIGVLLYLRRR